MRSVPEPVGDHSSAPLSGLPGALRDDLHALSRPTFITAKTDRKCLSTEKTLPVARSPNDLNLGLISWLPWETAFLEGRGKEGMGFQGPAWTPRPWVGLGGEECEEERRTAT
ncbi:unnamed protein product [Arctogadus glacialis]